MKSPMARAGVLTSVVLTSCAVTLLTAACGTRPAALPAAPTTTRPTSTAPTTTSASTTHTTTTMPVPTSTAPPVAAKAPVTTTPTRTPTPRKTVKVTPKPPAPPPPPPVTTPESSATWRACTANLNGVSVNVPAGQRSVTVVNGRGGSYATVSFHLRTDTACGFVEKFADSGGRVGYGGISSGANRQQGTGTTPTGVYTMTEAFGLNRNPGTRLLYRHAGAGDFWVEDNNSAYYNQFRNESQGGFAATLPSSDPNSSERLTDYPGQYAYAIVVNFNRAPDAQVAHRGAGIFVHVRGNGATAGCVALSQSEVVTMLSYMNPGDTITIVP